MPTHQATRYTQFITPLGAIVALICFFMPWTEMVRISMTISGFAWSKSSPIIGIALIANLIIVGLSFYMIIRRISWISKVLIFIISGIGISVLLQAYFNFRKLLEVIEITGKFGFWGTIIGFALAVVGAFLTRVEKVEERFEMFVDERYAWFIAHAAGIGALACFFIPWRGIGIVAATSGFDLAKWNPLITIAFIASVTIVVVNLYMLKRGTLWKSKAPVLVSSGIGFGVIFSYYIDYFATLNTLRKTGTEIGTDPLRFGLWGTVIGFIVAAIGMFLTTRKNRDTRVEISAESG